MGRSFYLYRRGKVYYAEILGDRGQRLYSRSTRAERRDDAVLIASEWLNHGMPTKTGERKPLALACKASDLIDTIKASTLDPVDAEKIMRNLMDRGLIVGSFAKAGPSAVRFIDFLKSAWTEGSPFLADRNITKRHIKDSVGIVHRCWDRDIFKDVLLIDLDRRMIKTHLNTLKAEGLAQATINKALAILSSPLNWAASEELIPLSPTAAKGLRKGAIQKTRGILSASEIASLFSLTWPDERARAAFLVALTCGLRRAEIVGLRVQDIGDDRLFLTHSYSPVDGLTCLKNKESRDVPLLPAVREALLNVAKKSPHNLGKGNYIFAGLAAETPIDPKMLVDGFIAALRLIGIDEKTRRERNLCLHSLRHGYATALASRVSENTAMKGLGHRSIEMTRHYAAHSNEEALTAIGLAIGDAFGNILPFKKQA